MSVRAVALGIGLAASATRLGAQVINGALVRADGTTPATGVIVVASGPVSDSALARTITGSSGRYTIAVPAGSVRLRALRIGHRPFAIGTFTLAAGATRDVRTVLPDDPIVLQAVTTRASTACRQTGATGEAVAAVFEEARKALMSTKLTSREGRPLVRYSLWSQSRTIGNRATSELRREFFEGESMRPFASVSPDSLARFGYVVGDFTGTTYRAPDADVLLSETFVSSHCLDLTDGTGDRAGWIGLTFRPSARPRGLVDVRGTLWLDRASSELRRMEYGYDGLSPALESVRPGGTVEFTRLADGAWFVNAWEIRMPRAWRVGAGMRAAGTVVQGGDVWRMTRGENLVYTNGEAAPLVTRPAATDSTAPARGGAPGAAWVQADTLKTESPCGPSVTGAYLGEVHGVVRDWLFAPLPDAVVTVEWQEHHAVMPREIKWRTRQLTTLAARDGYFAVCGVPLAWLVSVQAQFGSQMSTIVKARVPEGDGTARVDLRFGSVRGDAPGKGVVLRVVDIGGHPVPHALVEVAGGRGRITDDSGRVFLVAAPDSIGVAVRRIGYAPFAGRLGRAGATGEFTVVLPPIAQKLGAVTVTARANAPLDNTGFYDRMLRTQRGAFNADFITPEELDARPNMRVTDLFSGRRLVGLGRTTRLPPQTYLVGRGGCKMSVYLDGTLVNPEMPAPDNSVPSKNASADASSNRLAIVPIDELVDINSVAAVEIYASAANAPAELVPLSGTAASGVCGIVAIWTGGRH